MPFKLLWYALFRPDMEVYLMHNSQFRKKIKRRPVGTNLLIFYYFFPKLGNVCAHVGLPGLFFVCLFVCNFSFKSNLPNLYSLVIFFWIGIWVVVLGVPRQPLLIPTPLSQLRKQILQTSELCMTCQKPIGSQGRNSLILDSKPEIQLLVIQSLQFKKTQTCSQLVYPYCKTFTK